jgi:hypothetical protein
MPIWTQEQLFEIVVSNYKGIKEAEGKAPQDQLDKALQQTQLMETWLDADFRNKLDKIFERVE